MISDAFTHRYSALCQKFVQYGVVSYVSNLLAFSLKWTSSVSAKLN